MFSSAPSQLRQSPLGVRELAPAFLPAKPLKLLTRSDWLEQYTKGSMVNRFWLKLAAIVIAVALFVTVVEAWRADRCDRAQLTAKLAPAKQLLVAADARQHDRDAQLTQTLAEFAAEKRAVATPAQIIGELGKSIPLPAPITLQPDNTSLFQTPPARRTSAPS